MANSAVVGVLRALLTANTVEFDSAMARGAESAKKFSREMRSIGAQASQVGSALTKTLTLPLAGSVAAVGKLAMDFESSFAGVRKTVDGTEAEFAVMAQQFRNLAKEIPVNVNELNRLGEAAGALGIPKDDIVEFARVMAMLGVTTNLTSNQAADSIARIQNIFGAAGKDTDRLASTLVALGNAGASTESEIVEMAQRIAGAGHSIGLSQAQVLSFASTLASVGINAEAGGSSISRIFLKMNDAVMGGGKALEEFGRVAGVSGAEFKRAFETDAAAATVMFISGLGRLKTEGENTNATMESLIGKNIILKDTINRLSGSGQLLTTQLALGNKAWSDNSALTKEAGERFKTLSSQLTTLWNRVKDVGITLGLALMPAFKTAVEVASAFVPVIETIAKGFAAMPDAIKVVTLGLVAVGAAIGPIIFVAGQLVMATAAVSGAFATNGIAARGMAVALTSVQAQLPTLTAGLRAVGASAALTQTQVSALGLTLSGLGGLAAGAAAGFAGWQLGRVISEVFDLDNKIANLTARIFRLGDLAGEEAAAKMDVLKLASKNAGRTITDFSEALRINEQAVQNQRHALEDGKTTIDAFQGPIQSLASRNFTVAESLKAARAELTAMSAATRRDLVTAIDSGALSIKEMAEGTGLSEHAIKLFKDQLRDTAKAAREVAADFEAAGPSVELWIEYLREEYWAGPTEAMLELGDALQRLENIRHGIKPGALTGFGDDIVDVKPPDLGDVYGPTIEQLYEPIERVGDFLRTKLGASVLAAFQGGGNVGQTIGATVGGFFTGTGSTVGKKIADGLTKHLGGAIGGAIGSIIPGLGTVLGGLAGKVFGKIFDDPEKKINPIREAFVQLHGGLETLNGKAAKAGMSLNALLSAKNEKQYQAAINELNAAFEEHNQKIEKAKSLVEDLGPAMGVVTSAFKQNFDQFSSLGSQIADARKELESARDQARQFGNTDGIGPANKKLAELQKQQKSAADGFKQQLKDLGVVAVASVGAALEAGYSLSKAVEMNHDALAQLRQAYDDLGMSTEDAFLQSLFVQDAMVQRAPQLTAGVSSLGQAMSTLAQLGMLNAETFGAMERTGAAMYSKLQAEAAAAGGTTKDALLPMQTFLQEAKDRAEKLGIPLDANTEMLIEQSKELGIWRDKGKTANEILLEGLEKILAKMDQIIDRTMRAGDAMAGLVPPGVPTDGVPAYAARGGRVTRSGVMNYLAGGGYAGGWMPRGTDIVPAMLTPGELVVTASQQEALHSNAAALMAGANAGGGGGTLVVQTVMRDGSVIAEVVVPHLRYELRRQGII